MPRPRHSLVSLVDTPYYHCISRCVRRAFLCGKDKFSGRSYDHRKQWLVERFSLLADVFAIDICAYAVMSNHYHLVVHIDSERAQDWSADEIIERWGQLFTLPDVVARYLTGASLMKPEKDLVLELVQLWRDRLMDLSWFMRCVNEPIARQANGEDDCSGRFWEGRFKSQALLDEVALLACMTYVDLNPIRAKLSATLEGSDFTAIQARIRRHQAAQKPIHPDRESPISPQLLAFVGGERQDRPLGIPFVFSDYLALVDSTGRAIIEGKRGYIPNHVQPILTRLNIDPEAWLPNIRDYGKRFKVAVGTVELLRQYSKNVNKNWLHGIRANQALYRHVMR